MTTHTEEPARSPRKPEDIKRQPMCADCWGTDSHAHHCAFWEPAFQARA